MQHPGMRKSLWGTSLLLLLWGCAPLPDSTATPGSDLSPSAISSTTPLSPSPIASASPTSTAPRLPDPDLPAGVLKPLDRVAGLQPKMKETEAWWANSGISDNRLGYYATTKSSGDIEAELLPSFTQDSKPYLEGIGPVFDFDGTRVCIMKRTNSDTEELFVVVPLSDPPVIPKSLSALKLPTISPASLKGKKTLVVLATGRGLGEHVDHMLGQAGLVITPTPTPTPTATPTP